MKKITIILLFLIIFCSSCSILTNSNQTNENLVKFGVITDIQGDTTNLDYFTDEFNKAEVDAILILGDLNDMNKDIKETDYEEIDSVLESLTTGLLTEDIFVIPGNHESKEDYYNAIAQFDFLHDLSKLDYQQFDGIELVHIPGYHLTEYTNPDGFLFNNIMDYYPMKDCLADPNGVDTCSLWPDELTLLIAHGPPKGTNANSIDAISTGENVGNQQINEFILNNNINFGVFGHIHEAGMKAVDIDDEFVPENTWSSSLFLNPGPATAWQMNNDNINHGIFSKGSVAILEIDTENKKAKYEIVRVE